MFSVPQVKDASLFGLQMSLNVTSDTLTPGLMAMARRFADRRPILQAMGQAVVSLAKRAFGDESLRPAAWAPVKKTAERFQSSAPLKRSGALWQSIRQINLTGDQVEVGTDRPYAGYHQFGTDPYVIRPKVKKALFWMGLAHPVRKVNHPGLPARPFLPFDAQGEMTERGRQAVRQAAEAKMRAMSALGP